MPQPVASIVSNGDNDDYNAAPNLLKTQKNRNLKKRIETSRSESLLEQRTATFKNTYE